MVSYIHIIRRLSVFLFLLLAACGSIIDPFASPPELPDSINFVAAPSPFPTLPPANPEPGSGLSSVSFTIRPPAATVGPDCLGNKTNPIASAIAADYANTSYSEVMVWFCNGAQFEDIDTALLTQNLTAIPVEDMLEMLAGGFTWDEIWLVVGLTEGSTQK